MNDLVLDYFLKDDIPIYQNKNHFRFNTDTKLLAQFVHIKKGDVVLDIGTNNAAILRYLDLQPIERSIGVEVISEACIVAQKNVDSFFTHPCQIINQSIQEVDLEPVNVIVTNPPYFSEKQTNNETKMTFRQMGRIEKNLTLSELIENANRLLKSNGRFYMVHRPNRFNEIEKLLIQNNFQLKRVKLAYHKEQAKTILIEAIKEGTCDCEFEVPNYI